VLERRALGDIEPFAQGFDVVLPGPEQVVARALEEPAFKQGVLNAAGKDALLLGVVENDLAFSWVLRWNTPRSTASKARIRPTKPAQAIGDQTVSSDIVVTSF
jgi:ABC-type iron transport system FetAB ATPase subunit